MRSSDFISNPDPPSTHWPEGQLPARGQQLKLICRKGIPCARRTEVWSHLCGIDQCPDAASEYEASLEMLDAELSGSAPSFSGILHLDAFPLTEAGKSAAHRVLVVLHEQTAPQYCPLLACLVPILLLYLPEAHCYTALQTMLKRQRQQNAEASHDYFLRSRAEDLTFLRTFMELLWVKQYQAWKSAQHMQKLGVIAAPLKATSVKAQIGQDAGIVIGAKIRALMLRKPCRT
jgi:hypothetical protein